MSASFWQVVCSLQDDEVSSAVKRDSLNLLFGEEFFKKHGKLVGQINDSEVYDADNCDYIRQRMRLMGRLSIAGQSMGLSSIKDFILPENWKKVVKAVQVVAGFDSKKLTYRAPSVVLKAGHSLYAISDIVLCEESIESNKDKVTAHGAVPENLQAQVELGSVSNCPFQHAGKPVEQASCLTFSKGHTEIQQISVQGNSGR